jgi:hypothetical protein
MVGAFGTRRQQVQPAARHRLARVHVIQPFAQMTGARVIRGVCGDRDVPVVDREEINVDAQLLRRKSQASRGPSRATKQIGSADPLSHVGSFLKLTGRGGRGHMAVSSLVGNAG